MAYGTLKGRNKNYNMIKKMLTFLISFAGNFEIRFNYLTIKIK